VSVDNPATGVVLLHAATPEQLSAWQQRVSASAAAMPGFMAVRLSTRGPHLASAAAVTFDSGEHLTAWLDSPAYREALTDDVLGRSSVLLFGDGHRLPPGTAVFHHDVIPGRTDGFMAAEESIAAATAGFPGFVSLVLLPPLPGQHQWVSILSFHTDDQLSAWLASQDRAARVPHLRANLTRDFSIDAPFGSILRFQDGRPRVTQKWRTAMLIVLVLYPTAMLVTRFLAPLWIGWGAHPWLSTWLTQVVCVGAMTYGLMPVATRLFARWLDPVAGATVRVAVAGAAIVAAVYLGWLLLFGTVPWLQYWNHP
jgi:antibiotic biosynthesis monooxygenase (ABM) superfamily enzyme